MPRTFRSFAKLNLHLQVLGRRADGYHELLTVFQTIDLADRLTIESTPTAGLELEVVGAALAADRSNLVWRAAESFRDRYGWPDRGLRLRLEKQIPLGGGLGGGSSDAASVLLALARLRQIDPAEPGLADLARGLGADVPFFLVGGLALGSGRGDVIQPLPEAEETEAGEWIVAVPPIELATARVFGALGEVAARLAPPPIARALAGEAEPRPLAEWIGWNDLEEPARRLGPEIDAVYNSLVLSRAKVVRLSGSGAAVFARFDDPAASRAAGPALPTGTAWWRVRPLGRAAWRRASGIFD